MDFYYIPLGILLFIATILIIMKTKVKDRDLTLKDFKNFVGIVTDKDEIKDISELITTEKSYNNEPRKIHKLNLMLKILLLFGIIKVKKHG